MLNIRIVASILTDGSKTYGVKFEATHGDRSTTTVTIECESELAANCVLDSLGEHASFAYTDAALR